MYIFNSVKFIIFEIHITLFIFVFDERMLCQSSLVVSAGASNPRVLVQAMLRLCLLCAITNGPVCP
jgi:hypothetical protein